MTFQVRTLQRASRAYNQILNYISKRSESGAVAWAKAYNAALVRLERAADTFPLAPEDEDVDFELREILFKTRRGRLYRALFTIRGNDVLILHVRGPGQDLLTSDDLDPDFRM
jgi:toxin ParE1/3/4